MNSPKSITTVMTQDETGADVVSLLNGCPHKSFCYRRNVEGEALEVCDYLTYFHDWINPYGVQEYCARDAANNADK